MDIVVLVKQVPDTWAERKLAESDKTLDRESVDAVMNEIDEYAVEEALRLKEAHGGEVTILSMGPERATETIRKALSMGADKAVHVIDPALHGACAMQTAQALAAALGTIPYDLVVARLGVDRRPAVGDGRDAGREARPAAADPAPARSTVDGSTVTIERQTETGYDRVQGVDAGRGQRGREDQRAALPVVQGDHGRQEEAGADGHRRRPRPRRRRGRAWPARPARWSR